MSEPRLVAELDHVASMLILYLRRGDGLAGFRLRYADPVPPRAMVLLTDANVDPFMLLY